MLVRYCDACGRNLNNETVHLVKVIGFGVEDRENGKPSIPSQELCGVCKEKLREALAGITAGNCYSSRAAYASEKKSKV